jgi:hypothetical protein
VSVGAGSLNALGTLDQCFFLQRVFLFFRQKNLREFGKMCFSIVTLTNFAIFGAKFSQISCHKYERKTLLWISVFKKKFVMYSNWQ